MTLTRFIPLILVITLLLNSCGSGSSSNTDTSVEDQEFSLAEKEYLYDLFLTEYLWYDEVASNADYTQYIQPQDMINALRIDRDLWSFTMTQQEYDDYANQKTSGFGFGYTSDFQIFLVRINAPAYGLLFRGDEILEIDGEPVTTTLLTEASQNHGTPTIFTVLRNGTEHYVSITPNEYQFEVSFGKIITQGSKKIGYLRYDSFTESSVAEFEEIFTVFHNEDIDELVIDMRYNGGGSIATASALLDNITNAYPGQRQMYLDWNAIYQGNNSSYTFEDSDMQDGNELEMKRVFFLVTQSSASASEAVINALVPYLGKDNVITIGDDTYGKPVGMSGRSYGTNYYFLVNFFVRNNNGDTTSFDGIIPTCTAEDDLSRLMGDEDELMLKTALYYIETDLCL